MQKKKPRKEKKGSIVALMKKNIEKASKSSNQLFRFKSGAKTRVRFLKELEEGSTLVTVHNVWQGFYFPCPKYFGYKYCPFCANDHEYGNKLRTVQKFAISFYNYGASKVNFLLEASNRYSPLCDIIGYNDEYNTITDRDYVIKKTGEALDSNFTVIPGESKTKFKANVKALSEKEIFEILSEIYLEKVEEELGYSVSEEENYIELDDEEEEFEDEEEEVEEEEEEEEETEEETEDDEDDFLEEEEEEEEEEKPIKKVMKKKIQKKVIKKKKPRPTK